MERNVVLFCNASFSIMVTLEEELANSDLHAATDKSLNFRSEGGEGLYFSRGKVF